MREVITKYSFFFFNSNYRKYRYEPIEEPKKQLNRISIDEKLVIKVIMGCRTTVAHKVGTRLEFKQYDLNLTK